jgi:glutamate synthase domain-containing protein 3
MTAVVSDYSIDASEMHFSQLNHQLRLLVDGGAEHIDVQEVCGQRYLGTGLHGPVTIDIHGTPGNDMAAFMDGPHITVHGNAQDGCGNTMNGGEVVVHGQAGDVLGHSMRGGTIWVRGNAGYRVGIHMKEYTGMRPTIIIGGTAQHFLGEYMAGGILVILGLNLEAGQPHSTHFVGTGMHGGAIYIRGEIADQQLGKEVGKAPLDDKDLQLLGELLDGYAQRFQVDVESPRACSFVKLVPTSLRPYGRLYAY